MGINAETKKLISLGLMLVMVLSLFFGWFGVSKDYRRGLERMLSVGDYYEDMDEVMEEMIEEITDYLESHKGAKRYLRAGRRVGKALNDMRLSPSESLTILSTVGPLSRLNRQSDGELDEIMPTLTAVGIIFSLLFLCALGGALFGMYGSYTNSPRARLGYIISLAGAGLLLLAAIIATIVMNSYIEDEIGWLLDLDGGIIVLTAWPFIAIICAVGAFLLQLQAEAETAYHGYNRGGAHSAGAGLASFIGVVGGAVMSAFGKLKTAVAAGAAASGGWVCPNCRSQCASGVQFCTRCGTKKPEPKRCRSCGAILPNGVSFCPQCGSPAAQAPSAAVQICISCGAQVSPGNRFCPRCGNPMG